MEKENIEKAIDSINGLIYDCNSTMENLVEIKKVLDAILDEKAEGCVIKKEEAELLLDMINSRIYNNECDPVAGAAPQYLYKLQGTLLGALNGSAGN